MSVDSPVRVLVAAPTPSLAAGLAALVRAGGFAVVGACQNLEDPSAADTADVVVLAAGTRVGVDAFPVALPGVVIVGSDNALIADVTRLGSRAVGVVHAGVEAATLSAAIGAVAAGLSVRPADDSPTQFDSGNRPAGPRDGHSDDEGIDGLVEPEPLTAREIEVLDSLAQGLSNRAIAARLGISEHTVKFHLASIFGKLGVSTRTSAVRRGLRRGVIDL